MELRVEFETSFLGCEENQKLLKFSSFLNLKSIETYENSAKS